MISDRTHFDAKRNWIGKLTVKALVFIGVLGIFSDLSFALENLDEVTARKSRLAAATWGYTFLENPTTRVWQPETLIYTDVTTGNEVMRFSYAPDGVVTYTQDISITHWSANGARLMFPSSRPNSVNTTGGVDKTWFTARTDGSYLRPGHGLSTTWFNWSNYPAWNPAFVDTVYLPGGFGNYHRVYRNIVCDTSITNSPIVSVDNSATRRLSFKKSISADGSKLYFNDFYTSTVYVADLQSNTLDTPSTGYSQRLNFDFYWGGTVSYTGYHDEYVAGAKNGIDGIWKYIMPETSATDGPWWRSRLTGTGAGSAPNHVQDRTAPYDWGGELEPFSTITSGMNQPDPYCPTGTVPGTVCPDYLSHFTTDRWAHYSISSKGVNYPTGVSLLDMRTHNYAIEAFSGDRGAQHHTWDAWSDWSASSGSPVPYQTQPLMIQNYKNAASQKVIAMPHVRGNGATGSPYESLARPTQSPDGTKVMFNSTFLQATDASPNLFWSVAYYPYPPEIKSAAKNGGNVRLAWDFNQGSSCSNSSASSTRSGPTPNLTTTRTYATRGWPHETLDCPPSPREVKQFRVWTSANGSTWTPAGTTAYNNCSGANECGMWAETSWTFDYAQANGTTRYYGVTSQEHSGLESRTLSNVWRVTTDAGGTVTTQVQYAAYPADPGGKSNFYTTAPAAPGGLTALHNQAPAVAAGQYALSWTPPADTTLVRHYNIYAQDGSAPTATQQRRIASVPVGTNSFVDWLGNTNGTTQYAITSVDYQGNESLPVQGSMSDTIAPNVTVVSPANGATLSGVVAVTISASDNVAVSKAELYVNNILVTSDAIAPFSFSWDTMTVANGAYSIAVIAYDASGNSSISTVVSVSVANIVQDVLAPVVTIISPANNATVKGLVVFTASASDNIGVTRVDFYIKGVLRGVVNTAPFGFNWDTTADPNGVTTLQAKAYDAANNVGSSTAITVTVNNVVPDTAAPVVNGITIPSTSASLTVPVSGFSASDAVGVSGYLITESSTKPSAVAAGWSATAPTSFTFSSTGTRTAYAWAKDAAGNVSALYPGRTCTISLQAAYAAASAGSTIQLTDATLPGSLTADRSITVMVKGATTSGSAISNGKITIRSGKVVFDRIQVR